MDGWTNGGRIIDGWMDGRTEGRKEGKKERLWFDDACMDRWKDRQTDR